MKWSTANAGRTFRATAAGKKLLTQARTKLQELVSEVIEDKDARQIAEEEMNRQLNCSVVGIS